MTIDDYEQRAAQRKAESELTDANITETSWWYAQTADPYGNDPNLPEEMHQVGREYFARREGGPWILFDDLPDATRTTFEARVVENDNV